MRRKVQKDPANPEAHAGLGYALHRARRYPEAIQSFQKALSLNPNYPFVYIHLQDSLRLSGQPEQAFEASIKLLKPPLSDQLRERYKAGGWPAIWRGVLSQPRRPTNASARTFLKAHLGLGQLQDAMDDFALLEQLEDPWLALLVDPIFDPVRKEARFKTLLQRLHYPESMWR
jgi:tetratricopeptide (TPR) repeat protein